MSEKSPYCLEFGQAVEVGDGDAWERHAGWWQAGFTDGADAEYEEAEVRGKGTAPRLVRAA